jgi:exonuclease V gamma subunit
MIIRQAELCRQLVTDTAEHLGRLHEQGVDARSPVMPPCIELPAHVSLTGMSAMTPISLEVFGPPAEYIGLHMQNRGTAECPTVPLCPDDRSIHVQVCHSRMPAVEVLSDQTPWCFVSKRMDSQPPGHLWWPTCWNGVRPSRWIRRGAYV